MSDSIIDLLIAYADGNTVILAFLISSIAMILTSIGGLGILFLRRDDNPKRASLFIDLGLGFSSGIMIVASFTSLLIPAIDSYGVLYPVIGLVIGAFTVHIINSIIPHEHMVKGYEGPSIYVKKLKAAWLVAFAIIIHNLPEGLSIGVATGYSALTGITLGIAIAVQDIPEGLAVSLPIFLTTNSKLKGIFYAFLSGLSEVLIAVPAAFLASYFNVILPFAMGFGAGAMVYVVSHEAIPETHRSGEEKKATISFFVGFIVMIILDSLLG